MHIDQLVNVLTFILLLGVVISGILFTIIIPYIHEGSDATRRREQRQDEEEEQQHEKHHPSDIERIEMHKKTRRMFMYGSVVIGLILIYELFFAFFNMGGM